MAVTVATFTVTMLDAEYALMNEGVAAPTVSPLGVFGNVDEKNAGAVTASSSTGTTTVTIAGGSKTDYNVRVVMQRLRRFLRQNRTITFTP